MLRGEVKMETRWLTDILANPSCWLNQLTAVHFRFQPCALRCGITIYTQIKDLDKWIKLPQPFVQPETEHGVSPPYPLFPPAVAPSVQAAFGHGKGSLKNKNRRHSRAGGNLCLLFRNNWKNKLLL